MRFVISRKIIVSEKHFVSNNFVSEGSAPDRRSQRLKFADFDLQGFSHNSTVNECLI